MRYALPNARIMVHQPSGGFSGQASDIERHAEDIIKMKRRLNEVYVKHTGQTYEMIEKTLDRDYFMTAEQAMDFGLIDKVLQSRDETEAGVFDVKARPDRCSGNAIVAPRQIAALRRGRSVTRTNAGHPPPPFGEF